MRRLLDVLSAMGIKWNHQYLNDNAWLHQQLPKTMILKHIRFCIHCRYKPLGARDLPLEMESRILKGVDYLLNLKKSERAFVETGSKASPHASYSFKT